MIRTYTDVTESRTTRDKGPLDTTAHLRYFPNPWVHFRVMNVSLGKTYYY